MCYTYLMTEKTKDVITSKWCRACECFATHKNGECLRCEHNRPIIAETITQMYEGTEKVSDIPIKRGRGRPKGSKKKNFRKADVNEPEKPKTRRGRPKGSKNKVKV